MSSVVVVWQFRSEVRLGYDEGRERLALRLIAVSFFVLAAYVTFESLRDFLFSDNKADESPVGSPLATLSLMVMPALAMAKRHTADALGSPTLLADSRETLLSAWLSAALLGGLVLDAASGWSWADPVAGWPSPRSRGGRAPRRGAATTTTEAATQRTADPPSSRRSRWTWYEGCLIHRRGEAL